MPAANIEIGGVAASQFDATINTTLNLSNADTGGELTYLWEIIDQPDGTADVITSPTTEAASILVRKEGTYLIRLTVNQGSGGDERVDYKAIAVRYLTTGDRFPAAGETLQGGVDGWKSEATGLNELLRRHADAIADPWVLSVVAQSAGLVPGDLIKITSRQVVKSGLPGQAFLPGAVDALATTVPVGMIGSVIGPARPGGSSAVGQVLRARFGGLVSVSESGAPAVNDPVFVSDLGRPALVAGTNSRQIGHVVDSTAGTWYWFMDIRQT